MTCYSVAHTWPSVSVYTDAGSLFSISFINATSGTGCGRDEAASLDPAFETNYGRIKLTLVDLCGNIRDGHLAGFWPFVELSAMLVYAAASLGLVFSAVTYRTCWALPWMIIQCVFATLHAIAGFLVIVFFQRTMPMNLDDNVSFDWDETLGIWILNLAYFISACVLKFYVLFVAVKYIKMLQPPAPNKTLPS